MCAPHVFTLQIARIADSEVFYNESLKLHMVCTRLKYAYSDVCPEEILF